MGTFFSYSSSRCLGISVKREIDALGANFSGLTGLHRGTFGDVLSENGEPFIGVNRRLK